MPTYSYYALFLEQRPNTPAPHFCMFTAKVGEIDEWASIERLPEKEGAAQRAINKAKVAAIERFLELDARNSIPTAVVVSLKIKPQDLKNVSIPSIPKGTLRKLSIKMPDKKRKPGLIVDGQHRVLGMKKWNKDFPVNVIALLNADDLEVAFQFLVINNKASKVSTDHIRALALEYEEKSLDARLQAVRLNLDPRFKYVGIADTDSASPFRGLIDWPSNRDGHKIVKPAAIEAAIEGIERRQVREFRDDETVLTFFFAIWEAIRQRWPNTWQAGKKTKLLSKVGVVTLSEYITNALQSAAFDWGELDMTDAEAVGRKVNQLLDLQEERFWTVDWTSKSLDTQAGREIVVKALSLVARNKRARIPWYEDVDLIDVNQIERAAGDETDEEGEAATTDSD